MLSKVISLTQLSQNYWSLRFAKPAGFNFQAGQHISLKVHPDGHRRTYSLSNTPSFPHLELLADVSPMGPGSKLILSLKPGDMIDFIGPFGTFILNSSNNLFLAGGSGVAPFLSMQAGPILWSLRRKADAFSVKNSRIFYTRNHLTKYLSKFSDLKNYRIYLCGSPSYVTSLTKILLCLDVEIKNLHTEKFI